MRYDLLLLACTCLCGLGLTPAANAALHSETVVYHDGDVELHGYLVYDDAVTGKRPGVLVAPEWWGLNDYARHRAGQLAQLGYVAFAVDMYGQGKTTTDPAEAGAWTQPFRGDPALVRGRARAALEALRNRPEVDPSRLAGIGYCFGGMVMLELARDGADLKGVVSFHGALATAAPAAKGAVKAAVLALHGADDPFESPAEVTAFQGEMREAGANWQMNCYGGAVHSFTNPDADKTGMKGVAYNKRADERSWRDMKAFLAECLGE